MTYTMSNAGNTIEWVRTILILAIVFLAVLIANIIIIAAVVTVLTYLILQNRKKIRQLEAQLVQNVPKAPTATGTAPTPAAQSSEPSSSTDA
jgi:hypothetical protein